MWSRSSWWQSLCWRLKFCKNAHLSERTNFFTQITEQDILDRYKAVVHMVTAAKGAESFYMYSTEDNIKSESKSDEES